MASASVTEASLEEHAARAAFLKRTAGLWFVLAASPLRKTLAPDAISIRVQANGTVKFATLVAGTDGQFGAMVRFQHGTLETCHGNVLRLGVGDLDADTGEVALASETECICTVLEAMPAGAESYEFLILHEEFLFLHETPTPHRRLVLGRSVPTLEDLIVLVDHANALVPAMATHPCAPVQVAFPVGHVLVEGDLPDTIATQDEQTGWCTLL